MNTKKIQQGLLKEVGLILMLFLSGVLFGLLLSCHKEGHEHSDHEAHEHAHASEENHASSELSLSLNDGQKWQMDAHTRKSIQAMSAFLNEARARSSDLDFLKATGASLEGEMQNLIQGCTMTGEAHNQLHRILPPLQKNIQQLRKASSLEGAQKALSELESLFEKYHKYFK